MIYAAEPLMMQKGLSQNHGRLELDTEKQTLQYIKYKEQASGSVNIFIWIIIQVSRFLRKDKLIMDLPIHSITSIDDMEPKKSIMGIPSYQHLNINTNEKKYKFFITDETKGHEELVTQLKKIRFGK